jgi:phosphatidylglycerophosphate synthase
MPFHSRQLPVSTSSDVFSSHDTLIHSAILNSAGGVLALLAVTIALQQAFDLSALYALKAVLLFGGVVVLAAAFLHEHRPHPRLGPANQITLGRGLIAVLLGALVGEGIGGLVAWTAFALALLAEALDGLDGWLARHRGWVSAFGARFDMELDALLVAVLSLLIWTSGKAGAWVLLAGIMRYLFVGLTYAFPWMARPLPPSRRRQAVCVVQVLTLAAALAPVWPYPWSALVAASGLALLSYSFALDMIWLSRHAERAAQSGGTS